VEQLLPRFRAAHTQVLGISVDSVYCHANWARSLGGISFPLLADFEPKGELGRKYGLYLDGPGIDDRATVIVDSSGIVRHASTVGPGGRRDIAELAALCEKVDVEHGGGLEDFPAPPGLQEGSILYLKSHCGFFLECMDSTDPIGKKLGFIAQEMGREINTLGSKAYDAGIQRLVVEMKDELEKIKEQVLNVL